MEHSSRLYQTYTPTVFQKHKRKTGPQYRKQVVNPQPQSLQGELVTEAGTVLFIVLSLVCKSRRQSVDGSILRRWINTETVSHTLIITCQDNIVNIWYRTTRAREGQATTNHPSPH